MNTNLNLAGLPDGVSLLLLGMGSILAALFMRRRVARAREGTDTSGISATPYQDPNLTAQRPPVEQLSATAPFGIEDRSPLYQSSSKAQ
jgi:hypothetical protein